MQSKIFFKYTPNGNLEQVETRTDKLFQGQIGTVDYRIEMADKTDTENNWRSTDIVLMSFVRPDGKVAQRVMMWDVESQSWNLTSNGWETDVDIDTYGAELKISFVCKR